MRAHYQTDLGKVYYYFPYQPYLDNPNDSVRPFDVFDLIPPSINTLLIEPINFECRVTGINSRYLEVFDYRDNTYIIPCPLPWIEIGVALFPELQNDSRLKGWVAYGEKIKYRNLLYF